MFALIFRPSYVRVCTHIWTDLWPSLHSYFDPPVIKFALIIGPSRYRKMLAFFRNEHDCNHKIIWRPLRYLYRRASQNDWSILFCVELNENDTFGFRLIHDEYQNGPKRLLLKLAIFWFLQGSISCDMTKSWNGPIQRHRPFWGFYHAHCPCHSLFRPFLSPSCK